VGGPQGAFARRECLKGGRSGVLGRKYERKLMNAFRKTNAEKYREKRGGGYWGGGHTRGRQLEREAETKRHPTIELQFLPGR